MSELEDRVAVLEATVSELRAELAALRAPRMDTMARTFRCPACGGHRVVHFRQVTEIEGAQIRPFSLSHRRTFFGAKRTDPVEAFVCRACRLVEWRLASLDRTEIDGDGVIEIDSTNPSPAAAPVYR